MFIRSKGPLFSTYPTCTAKKPTIWRAVQEQKRLKSSAQIPLRFSLYTKSNGKVIKEKRCEILATKEGVVSRKAFYPLFRNWIGACTTKEEDFNLLASVFSNKKIKQVEFSPILSPSFLYGMNCFGFLTCANKEWLDIPRIFPASCSVRKIVSVPFKGIEDKIIPYEETIKENYLFIQNFFHNQTFSTISWVTSYGVQETYEKVLLQKQHTDTDDIEEDRESGL